MAIIKNDEKEERAFCAATLLAEARRAGCDRKGVQEAKNCSSTVDKSRKQRDDYRPS
jgi:hypothetical protein